MAGIRSVTGTLCRAAAIAGEWAGSTSIHLRRKHPERIGLLFFIDLLQDIELILPIAEKAQKQSNFEVKILMTEWLDRFAPSISQRVVKAGFEPVRCSRHSLGFLRLNDWDALLTASESSDPAHRFVRQLTRRANACGLLTCTIQHGLENVGLNYFAEGEHSFDSQLIFTWAKPEVLSNRVRHDVRKRCVGVGRPMAAPRKKQLPIDLKGRRLIGVFENLHWQRFNDAYRKHFLSDFLNTVAARPDVFFVARPHPAGRFLSRHASQLSLAPDNLILADPTSEEWGGITALDVLGVASAALTTPSTIALDAASQNVPVAVARYGTELSNYAPLPLLDGRDDWNAFIDRALMEPADARLQIFRRRHQIEGNACVSILDHIAGRQSKAIASEPEGHSAADLDAWRDRQLASS